MEFYKGEDRILYIKYLGAYLPIACLTENPFSETSDFIDTTTRDNAGWQTSRPTMQSYNISFSGLQVNSATSGGNFNVLSYDMLKKFKRQRILLDWKIDGNLPTLDYGKCYVQDISEANNVGEFLTFSGLLKGYGIPLTTIKGTDVLGTGIIDEVIVTDTNENKLIRTREL